MTVDTHDTLLLQALKGKKTNRPPFWFMRQAGRYLPEYRKLRAELGGFWDLVFTPEKAARVTLQPIERFDMDGAILFSDILVIPYALGQQVSFQEKVGPVLSPLNFSKGDFGLRHADIEASLGSIFETIQLVKKELSTNKTLIGFAGSPWTVATYMVEGKGTPTKEKTRSFAQNKKEKFQDLINLIVDSTIEYLLGQVKAGAQALQLFDSWAGALADIDEFSCWSIAPTREIVLRLKKEIPHIPLIGFPKGAGEFSRVYFKETNLDAINIDYSVDLNWAVKELQPIGCVQGNLDPTLLVEGGNKLLEKVREIVTAFQNGPYVFNLGHGIVPETPPENVAALSAFLKSCKRE